MYTVWNPKSSKPFLTKILNCIFNIWFHLVISSEMFKCHRLIHWCLGRNNGSINKSFKPTTRTSICCRILKYCSISQLCHCTLVLKRTGNRNATHGFSKIMHHKISNSNNKIKFMAEIIRQNEYHIFSSIIYMTPVSEQMTSNFAEVIGSLTYFISFQ